MDQIPDQPPLRPRHVDYADVIQIIQQQVVPPLQKLGESIDHLRTEMQQMRAFFEDKYYPRDLADKTFLSKDDYQKAEERRQEKESARGWTTVQKIQAGLYIALMCLNIYVILGPLFHH